MGSKDNLALDLEHGVRRWDRARWISVFSSHNPTIREVTECLGLGLSASSSTTNRGIPKFDNPDYRKLSSEVTRLSKELPKERDALLDFAADPLSLHEELEELLAIFGPAIWSRDADRSCLLTPDSTKKTYTKDLVYDNAEHKEILKIHMHRWIIIKACYYIRNMKLKRPSNVNEYDSIADLDGEGLSPHGTPSSLTSSECGVSMSADFSVKPVNLKKRKSSAHLSMSDGEDGSPSKRAYSTMPTSRNGSPRKSFKSIVTNERGSMEDIMPFPARAHHEAGRVQLSPLSSSEQNGVVRPASISQSPKSVGFTAVNAAGFTAVNTNPPVRESSREVSPATSKEPRQTSPVQRQSHTHDYTSPYEPASRNATIATHPLESNSATPMSTASPPAGPQSTTSGPISNAVNGTSIRQSPNIKHAYSATQPQSTQPLSNHPMHQLNSNIQSHSSPYGQAPAQSHIQAQPQPLTRPISPLSTPAHPGGRPLAPHPPSRSNTPLAQVASNQSTTAPNAQALPAPTALSAPHHGFKLVPIQEISAPPKDHRTMSFQAQHNALQHQHAPHPVLKNHAPEHVQHAQTHQAMQRPMASSNEIRLLQCEVTAGLFTFFYPRSTAPPDEPSLLQRLQSLWYHCDLIFRAELGLHYDLISKVLTAWLHERQAITALRHSLACQPGVSHLGLVDRLLAMNDLRVMRLKWKNMSTVDGLSPEDLLCQAFRVMTNTEGSEYLFKDGLERLNGGVFEFLRSEDAKIVMQRR